MVSISIPSRPIYVSLKVDGDVEKDPSPNPLHICLTSGDYIVRNVYSVDINDTWLSLFNNHNVLRGLNLSSLDFTTQRLREFIRKFDNSNNYFLGIFRQNDGKFVGFYTIDVNHAHRVATFTTAIDSAAEKGRKTLWATNDVVLDYFYKNTIVEKFTARVVARNYAMIFNFRSAPTFFFEGCLRDECRAPDGSRVDILVFSSFKNLPVSYQPDEIQQHVVNPLR